MAASQRLRALARPRLGLALLAPLALVLSCAEMPTAPTQLVHFNGTVQDKEGQAMGFIAVDFWAPGYDNSPDDAPPGEPVYYRAITRSDGAFDIWLPARLYDVEIIPWDGSGYARATLRSVQVGTQAPRLDYRYAWPRVTIRTVQPGGVVIANSWVKLLSRATGSGTLARPDGDALAAVVPPGSYFLLVDPGGLESGYIEQFTELAVVGDTTITLTAGGDLVSARVLGQNGDPLSGAFVQTGTDVAYTRTGADGVAVFHLPSGSYSFSVWPSETYIASRYFPYRTITGPETFDLDVSGSVWSGTVRRAGDGTPVAGVKVGAFLNPAGYFRAYVESDAVGAFRLIVEKGAVYDILMSKAGEEVGIVRGVFAGSDSTFDLIANVPIP